MGNSRRSSLTEDHDSRKERARVRLARIRARLTREAVKKDTVEYIRLLGDYRDLFLCSTVLFGPSIILMPIFGSFSAPQLCQGTMLCAHGATPWGVITSVFLFDSWLNIPSYLTIIVLYVSFSGSLSREERRKRAAFASAAIFLIGFAANALWVAVRPDTFSWGPSGVVYSLLGVLMVFTLFDGIPARPTSWNPRDWYGSKEQLNSAMNNLVIFSSTVLILFLNPAQFLSAGPNINVFVHAISFLGGYFAAFLYRSASRGPSAFFTIRLQDG